MWRALSIHADGARMKDRKVLFVGGTGVVGSRAVTMFRERHPEIPILVGGRDLTKARKLAETIGSAEAVSVNTNEPDLGLSRQHALAAVVMMVPDDGLHGLVMAQELGIAYLSIGNWLAEVGAEMAHFMRRPQASPIVLSSHWHGGTAVCLASLLAAGMDRVRSIRISATVDERDATGPAAIADMDRGSDGGTGILAFRNGSRVWLSGDTTKRVVEAVDGRKLTATAFAPYDVVSLHAITQARDIRFDIASGVSSSRLRGGDIGTELVVEVEGDIGGEFRTRRSTLEFTRGQATLTAISVVLTLTTLLGLEDRPPAAPALYFPEHLINAEVFLAGLVYEGARVTGIAE